MEKQYKIKWKQQDYLQLGKAVSNFNKKINELNKEEKRLYLPELIDYKNVKEEILTRQDYNQIINSLRRFSKKGAEELYITQAGEEMTKWERKELGLASKRAQRRLQKAIERRKQDVSLKYMGDTVISNWKGSIKKLGQIETRAGAEFRQYVKEMGSVSYDYKRLIVYRETYLHELEKIANEMEEFKPMYEYLKTIESPYDFYYNIVDVEDRLKDFFAWYRDPANYASYKNAQELANDINKILNIET